MIGVILVVDWGYMVVDWGYMAVDWGYMAVDWGYMFLLIIIATLATAEVLAGAVAKADQNISYGSLPLVESP